MLYQQSIQTMVKCLYTWMVKKLQMYKPRTVAVNVAKKFTKLVIWRLENTLLLSLTKQVNQLLQKESTL